MSSEIKVGDLVETCILMSGVVMKVAGDDIEVRMLDVDEYQTNDFQCCSIKNCGIVKLTAKQAYDRVRIGRNRLTELWALSELEGAIEDRYQRYLGLLQSQS